MMIISGVKWERNTWFSGETVRCGCAKVKEKNLMEEETSGNNVMKMKEERKYIQRGR